jgi:integrase
MKLGERGIASASRHPVGWRARVYYRDWTGERREMCRFAKTKAAALERLDLDVTDALRVGQGSDITDQDSFITLAEMWMDELDSTKLSANSKRTYRYLAGAHILAPGSSPLRLMPLRLITPARVTEAVTQVGNSAGPGSAKTVHAIYRMMFDLALQHEALESNPARQGRTPTGFDKKITKADRERAFVKAELDDVLNKLKVDKRAASGQLQTLVRVLAGTGMRIGEACGLAWSDMIWNQSQLHVRGTKTKTSDRVIVLPEWLMAALRKRSDELAPLPGSPICPNSLGKRRTESSASAAVSELLDRYGCEWATSHTFRHSVATFLDEAGMTPREIAIHLGHAQPSMTMDKYMDRRRIITKVAEFL